VQHTLIHWTTEWARRSGKLLVLASLVAAGACGSDSPAGPSVPTTPVGSYTIATVNGKVPPVAVFADGSYTYEVTNATISLTSDGKYSGIVTFRQTVPGNVSTFVDTATGTWVQAGANIQMTSSDGLPDSVPDTGTWDKGVLTFVEVDATSTTTYVYNQKR
jgi:hypothetical protein